MRIARPFVHELSTLPDVLAVAEQLANANYPLLLDSATYDALGVPGASSAPRNARYSFAAADPSIVIRARESRITTETCETGTIVRSEGRVLDVVQVHLTAHRREHIAELPPFQGGFAGYVGYEYAGMLERIPRAPHQSSPDDDVVLAWYPWVVAWDHEQGRVWIIAESEAALKYAQMRLAERQSATQHPPLAHDATQFTSSATQPEYEAAVTRIRDYIAAGDVFQVNLSHQLAAPLYSTPWSFYKTLRTLNPAPFAAYFDTGDAVIASSSPERFLHLSADGRVETRPIKGTRPRGATSALDQGERDALLHSAKDAAEHVMIVDVLRNDIARVCTYGSVQVPELMVLEPYATVHHLVSTVIGQLRPDADAVDLLHACFPGGSITGAPKVRAMEIIAELEPVTRGVYCGAIGYLSASGVMDTNIAIRTAVITGNEREQRLWFSAGGGIVYDSDPANEYAETLDKARALQQAVLAANDDPTRLPVVSLAQSSQRESAPR